MDDPDDGPDGPPEDDPPEETPDEDPDEEPDAPDEPPEVPLDESPEDPLDTPTLPPSPISDGLPIPRIESHPALLAPTSPVHTTITAHVIGRITRPLSRACPRRSSPRSVPLAPRCSARGRRS